MQNSALVSASLVVLGSFLGSHSARIRLTLAISKYNVEYASTTLAKKIETGTQAKHRRVHARQITRLCHVRVAVSIFLARVVVKKTFSD